MYLLRWFLVLLGVSLLVIGAVRWAALNPDDTYLVLESEYQFANNTYEYYLTPPDGSERLQLSARLGHFQYLHWTSDPEWLTSFNSRTNRVTFVNLTGREQQGVGPIQETRSGPVSPDNQWLTFYTVNSPPELIITNTQGQIQQRTPYPGEIVSNVFWSPDSQQIYMVLCPRRQPCQMYRMALTDGILTPMAELSSNYIAQWDWSPDGQWLLGTNSECVTCLLTLSADGQSQYNLEFLSKAIDPALWSDDSQWIIYRHDDQIMRARLDGSEISTIATLDLPDHPILFQSPDHEWVYYGSGMDLYSVNVEEGIPQLVYTNVAFSISPAWLSEHSLVLATTGEGHFEIVRVWTDDTTPITSLGRLLDAGRFGEAQEFFLCTFP